MLVENHGRDLYFLCNVKGVMKSCAMSPGSKASAVRISEDQMKCPGDPLAIIQAWEAGSSIRFVGVQNQRTLTELEVFEVDPTTTLWYNMTLDLYGFSKVHVITASLDGSTSGWHVL